MRFWILPLLAGAVAAVSGCGGSPAVYPVKGTITFEGKPMKGGGSISFMPLGNQEGKTAGAEIKQDGTYELMTNQPGDGSMAGDFRVVIVQSTEREPDATKDGERTGRSLSVVSEAERIPPIYGNPMQSPLKTKVEAKTNQLDFDLKKNAGPPPIKGA
jgi:hypothetical protein